MVVQLRFGLVTFVKGHLGHIRRHVFLLITFYINRNDVNGLIVFKLSTVKTRLLICYAYQPSLVTN